MIEGLYLWWYQNLNHFYHSNFFQKRVSATFPKPIDVWALTEAQEALKKGRKKSALVLPFDKVHSLLKEVLHNNKLDDQVSLYLVAVLDYIAADILKVNKQLKKCRLSYVKKNATCNLITLEFAIVNT